MKLISSGLLEHGMREQEQEGNLSLSPDYMMCPQLTYVNMPLICPLLISLALLQDFLPADIQAQFAASRELIRNIYNSFYKLRDRAERIASRAIDNASDLLIFGKELR